MATAETWKKVAKVFRKTSTIDSWGNPYLLNDEHLLRLYDFRIYLNMPVYVLHAVKTKGHSKSSYHYPENGACATDLIIPGYNKNPYDLVLDATRFGFTGIGYYPHWKDFKGRKVGGIHVDSRPLRWDEDETKNYSHSRWMGVLKPGYDSQQYIELNYMNMLKYT